MTKDTKDNCEIECGAYGTHCKCNSEKHDGSVGTKDSGMPDEIHIRYTWDEHDVRVIQSYSLDPVGEFNESVKYYSESHLKQRIGEAVAKEREQVLNFFYQQRIEERRVIRNASEEDANEARERLKLTDEFIKFIRSI